ALPLPAPHRARPPCPGHPRRARAHRGLRGRRRGRRRPAGRRPEADDLLLPLAGGGQGDVRRADQGLPGEERQHHRRAVDLPLRAVPGHRADQDPRRLRRRRVHRLPRRPVRVGGQGRSVRRPHGRGIRRQLPGKPDRAGPARGQAARPAVPAGLQRPALQQGGVRQGRRAGADQLAGVPGHLPQAEVGRLHPGRVPRRRPEQRRPAAEHDGDEQPPRRRRLRPARAGEDEGDRRVVGEDADAVQAGAGRRLLRPERAGHQDRRRAGAVRPGQGGDPADRLVPGGGRPQAGAGPGDRPVRADHHRDPGRGEVRGRLQRDLHPRGERPLGEAGGGQEVRRVPLRPGQRGDVRQRHRAAGHRQGRQVRQPGPRVHRALADEEDAAGPALPVHQPGDPQRDRELGDRRARRQGPGAGGDRGAEDRGREAV
ncbi:MAG: ABC transporter, substrate-binding protein (cluster 1, maltose/g3p/polyamine/iron), partial [uncultured Corynebacteriales bacterium]